MHRRGIAVGHDVRIAAITVQFDLLGRRPVAAMAQRVAHAAVQVHRLAIEHANSRRQFNKTLGDLDLVKKKIAEIEPRLLLADLIRRGAGLTGTHRGCDTTNCGACTVLVDGAAIKSCTMLAVQVDGREVTTVEGLATASELHPVQEGFRQEHGLQCGFCTPGMMLAAKALLDRNPDPTEEDVRWALSGNLCRCTGYQNIVKSVLWAAEKLRAEA